MDDTKIDTIEKAFKDINQQLMEEYPLVISLMKSSDGFKYFKKGNSVVTLTILFNNLLTYYLYLKLSL